MRYPNRLVVAQRVQDCEGDLGADRGRVFRGSQMHKHAILLPLRHHVKWPCSSLSAIDNSSVGTGRPEEIRSRNKTP